MGQGPFIFGGPPPCSLEPARPIYLMLDAACVCIVRCDLFISGGCPDLRPASGHIRFVVWLCTATVLSEMFASAATHQHEIRSFEITCGDLTGNRDKLGMKSQISQKRSILPFANLCLGSLRNWIKVDAILEPANS